MAGWKPVVPVSFFAIVLGTCGLGNSWRVATKLWGVPAAIGETIVAIGALIWLALVALYVAKWLLVPTAARAELDDPIQCCFIGLIGVAGMLVAGAILPYVASGAYVLFAVMAVFTFAFGLWRTGLIWRGSRAATTTTAVLYLPLVAGSFVCTTVLGAIGATDWAQLTFGAGFFSWLAIESVLLHRLYTAEPLAEPLRPTLGIQLAPPTVGAVAYLNATGSSGDIIVHAMLGYGILQFILLARMLPWITRRFVPSIWSFSFGITALATATETLTLRGDKGAIAMLSMPAFLIANVLVGVFAVGTLMLLAQRRLLPAPAPLKAP